MGLFSDYVIWIKFKDEDEGCFVGISEDGGNIIYNRHLGNAKKYGSRVAVHVAIGYHLSDFEDITNYTEVERL